MAILTGIGIFILLVVAGIVLFIRDITEALEIFDSLVDWDR